MMKSIKKPFKLSVLGIFRLEAESMTILEILLIIVIVMGFVIILVILLKTYALPILMGFLFNNFVSHFSKRFHLI
jgi:hypothetical protein